MTSIVLAALSAAFILVRILKGPWMRHPQYVAAATIGAVACSLLLYRLAPDLEQGIIVGGLAGFAGAWAGIALFSLI